MIDWKADEKVTASTVRRLTIEDFGEDFLAAIESDRRAALETYLEQTAFAVFDDTLNRCRCGRAISVGQPGDTLGVGTFTWSLVHGEGYCYNCGWPGRRYHYLTDARGTEFHFSVVLPYHPDSVTLKGDSE